MTFKEMIRKMLAPSAQARKPLHDRWRAFLHRLTRRLGFAEETRRRHVGLHEHLSGEQLGELGRADVQSFYGTQIPLLAEELDKVAPPRRLTSMLGRRMSRGLWIGAQTMAHETPMHFDSRENLYVMLSGEKRFLLLPQHSPHVRPVLLDANAAVCTAHTPSVDDLAPDDGWLVTLRAGEMLYLPSYVWHRVWTEAGATPGLDIAANLWFAPHSSLATALMEHKIAQMGIST